MLDAKHPVLLYDGVCGLCNRLVQFVLRHDRGGVFCFASLQSRLAADILVYDLDKLNILPREIVHDVPPNDWRRVQRAEGYRWIMVNGQVTFEDGKGTGAHPGKLLRHGQAS